MWLVAGENDMALLAKSGSGATSTGITTQLKRSIKRFNAVVRSLFELIRFRNQHLLLMIVQYARNSGPRNYHALGQRSGLAMLEVDFASGSYSIFHSPIELLGPKQPDILTHVFANHQLGMDLASHSLHSGTIVALPARASVCCASPSHDPALLFVSIPQSCRLILLIIVK
jgi:hypothetical protein